MPEIVTDGEGLSRLVHDRRFDLEEFAFDRELREARLYMSEGDDDPCDAKLLRITDVSDVSIHDPDRIQIYMLYGIEIAPASVRITTCTNLEITLAVGEQRKVHIEYLRDIPPARVVGSIGELVGEVMGEATDNLLRRLRLKGPKA